MIRRLSVVGCLLAIAFVATAATPAPTSSPTPVPTRPPTSGVGSIIRIQLGPVASVSTTTCIAGAPDGSVWLLAAGPHYQLVNVTAQHAVTATAFPGGGGPPGDGPQCLAVTGDGAVWVGSINPSAIARRDPTSGKVTEYPTPTPNSAPAQVAAAPDGDAWFLERNANQLARADAAGHITEFPLPSSVTKPGSIAVTPDGHVWVVATGPSALQFGTRVSLSLFEFSPQGQLVHEIAAAHHPVPAISVGLHGYVIAAGPGGRPFFGWGPYPFGVSLVGADSTAQGIAWTAGDIPAELTLGPDGRLWFVVPNANFSNYGYVDPQTLRVTLFHGPVGVSPEAIAAGPGEDMSFVGGDNYLYVAATGVTQQAAALAPSTIASSLPTPAQAFASVAVVVSSAVLAAGGTMFITFPAQLFNLTFQENYPVIAAWWGKRRRRIRERMKRLTRTKPLTAAAGETPAVSTGAQLPTFAFTLAVGALLGAMLDPHFGRSWSTLVTYASTILAIVTGVLVTSQVTAIYHRRTGGDVTRHLRALPLGLLVAAVCVAVSRLVSFQPGYLYGVVCGVAFQRKLGGRQEGHVATLSVLTTLVVSIAAWLIWVPVNHAAAVPGAFAGTVLADDFLAAVFVSGLVGSAVGLLPLRFMTGGAIAGWRRDVWALMFFATVFLLVDVVVRSPSSAGSHTAPLLTTVVLFLLFGGVAVIFREYFARRWRSRHGVVVRGPRAWLEDLFKSHPA